MGKAARIVITLAVIAAFVAAIVYWQRPEPVAVELVAVEQGQVAATAANTRVGTVEACRRARLSPAVGGQVARLPHREGEHARAGDLLVELWNEDLQARLELAEQERNAARARAEATCHKADVADREASRLVRLGESGAVSEEQVDQAVTAARARRADCQASRASIQVSAARVALARANLEQTRLRAPFDGVVADLSTERYEYATPSPPGIQTQPVIDLIGSSCFFVSAPIDEVDAPAVETGMPAVITLDAFPGAEFAGRVRRVADYVVDIEKQARTVEVEVAFASGERPDRLLAGYSADVEIVLEARDSVPRIPTEALMGGGRVLVLAADGRLAEREVETGLANWEYTEITAGLAPGERVVLDHRREAVHAGLPARAAEAVP